MTQALQLPNSLLTVEEFDKLADVGGAELIDGQVVEKSMAMAATFVGFEFSLSLGLYLRQNPVAHAFTSEQGYELPKPSLHTARKPDISLVLNDRLPQGWQRLKTCPVRPDLAFEAISPDDKGADIERKLFDYRRLGVPLIWVVYPDSRLGRTLHLDGTGRMLSEDEYFDGGNVLPGFRVKLADLLPPPTDEVPQIEATPSSDESAAGE